VGRDTGEGSKQIGSKGSMPTKTKRKGLLKEGKLREKKREIAEVSNKSAGGEGPGRGEKKNQNGKKNAKRPN